MIKTDDLHLLAGAVGLFCLLQNLCVFATLREILRRLCMRFLPPMCRNIKPLFNFEPAVTAEEIRAASLQFVRKITGFNKVSKTNEASFLAAVDEIAGISTRLLRSLETNAPPKNREEEAAKAKLRAAARFGA
jgi:hypothetical protein